MTIREKFDVDLHSLQDAVIELYNKTEIALTKSFEALNTRNIDLALQIFEEDRPIDRLEEEINDFAIMVITRQQPVATDLRRVIVSIKIASDLERLADYAVNIAKATIKIANEDYVKPLIHLNEMHKNVLEMLTLAIESYREEDVAKAKKVAELDDRIDELYGIVIKDLLSLTPDNSDKLTQISQLSFVARYLERAGDHITNIAESTLYLVKGRHYILND
ncbi:MAG: phosphate transport system regulatory protein PhoU [Bacillales bacterium]|jgi:phosphate transport system protein|nr:phosphate transport system regulatory protein PhoU [Bacillales bacterium]